MALILPHSAQMSINLRKLAQRYGTSTMSFANPSAEINVSQTLAPNFHLSSFIRLLKKIRIKIGEKKSG